MNDLSLVDRARAFLSYAVQQLPPPRRDDREEWNAAVEEYFRCLCLMNAAEEFGSYNEAYAEYLLSEALVDEQSSGAALNVQRRHKAAIEELDQAESTLGRDFHQPFWNAQQVLIHTPAPDFSAAIFKVELIKQDDLHMTTVADDCFALVAADFARITKKTDTTMVSAEDARRCQPTEQEV